MKMRVVTSMLTLPLLLAASSSALALNYCGRCKPYLVVGRGVKVRAHPNKQAGVVRRLTFDSHVCVYGMQGDWYQVKQGFVFRQYAIPKKFLSKGPQRRHQAGSWIVPYRRTYFSDNVTRNRFSTFNSWSMIGIYGPQKNFNIVRPIFEFGRPLYAYGPMPLSGTAFGKLNPTMPQLLLYGFLDTVYGLNFNQNRVRNNLALVNLNLDADLQITSTERIHLGFSPFRNNNDFTRFDFRKNRFQFENHATLNSLFFEGDLGNIAGGLTGKYSSHDIPFAVGLIPLIYQNGVWFNDTVLGAALSLQNWYSDALHISKGDISIFAGFDQASNPAFTNSAGKLVLREGKVFGANAFIEAAQGYFELGAARAISPVDNLDFDSVGVSFTRRYGRFSNSIRVMSAFGQHAKNGRKITAEGAAIILENSYITHLPLTLVPYLNVFIGIGRPQPASSFNGVGVLNNVGINFATDAQTGFPNINNGAGDTFGGALGVEYLFNLEQQVVLEFAAVFPYGPDVSSRYGARPLKGEQVAWGIRYQIPFGDAWIFRTDGIVGLQSKPPKDTRKDFEGLRIEFIRKF